MSNVAGSNWLRSLITSMVEYYDLSGVRTPQRRLLAPLTSEALESAGHLQPLNLMVHACGKPGIRA